MRRIGACWLLLGLTALWGCGGGGAADGAGGSNGTGGSTAANDAGLKYVTDDAFACLLLRPKQIMQSKLLASLPPEKIDALLESSRELPPINPREIEYLVVAGTSAGGEPMPLVAVKFVSQAVRDAAVEELTGPRKNELEYQGTKYFTEPRESPERAAYFFPDDTTVVIATEPRIKRIIEGKAGESAVVARLKKLGLEFDAVGAIEVAPIRQQASEMLADGAEGLPPEMAKLLDSFENVNAASATLSLSGDRLLQVAVDAKDQKSAETMVAAGNEGLAAGKQMLGGFFGTVLAAGLPEDDAGKKLHELIVELVGSVSVKSSGATVEIAAARPKGFDNLPSIIVAAANAAEKAAATARRESRLWQVGTALTDHAIRDRRFPAAASYSPEGKPLLSWRVALLPLLGYSKLHAEFHHDEPWNSEHNLKLLEKLPTVYGGTYQDPRSEDVPDTVRSTQERPADGGPAAPNTGEEQGKPAMAVAPDEGAKTPPGVGLTRLVVLVGPGTAFERTTGVKMQDLTDGLSNVVLIVEAPQDRAVPWTKPADLAFDPANPLAAIGGKLPDDGLMIVFADGRVETLDASTTTAEQFKALVSIAGGESNER